MTLSIVDRFTMRGTNIRHASPAVRRFARGRIAGLHRHVLDSIPSSQLSAAQRLVAWHRLAVVTLLGFASGLPLALTGQAMQAWLSMEGLDVATIGLLSLVGLAYPFNVLLA